MDYGAPAWILSGARSHGQVGVPVASWCIKGTQFKAETSIAPSKLGTKDVASSNDLARYSWLYLTIRGLHSRYKDSMTVSFPVQ